MSLAALESRLSAVSNLSVILPHEQSSTYSSCVSTVQIRHQTPSQLTDRHGSDQTAGTKVHTIVQGNELKALSSTPSTSICSQSCNPDVNLYYQTSCEAAAVSETHCPIQALQQISGLSTRYWFLEHYTPGLCLAGRAEELAVRRTDDRATKFGTRIQQAPPQSAYSNTSFVDPPPTPMSPPFWNGSNLAHGSGATGRWKAAAMPRPICRRRERRKYTWLSWERNPAATPEG